MGHCRFREIICKHMVERRADTKWKDTRQHLTGFDSGSFGANPNPPRTALGRLGLGCVLLTRWRGKGHGGAVQWLVRVFPPGRPVMCTTPLSALQILFVRTTGYSPPPPPNLEPLSHGWKAFRRQLLVGKTPEHKPTDRLTPVSQPPYSFTVCIRKNELDLFVCVPV